jgi:serine/threonine protein kinase
MPTNPANEASQLLVVNDWFRPEVSRRAEAYSGQSKNDSAGVVDVGQILGHYRLVEQISRGGMGVVYRAHDEHLEREVALKVLPPASRHDPVACRRFHNEALILSKLNHPNIVAVHDFNTDGVDFLIMEYIQGQTLSARLEEGPLIQDEIVSIGRQIAAAVQEAHDQGIIHRDLKPQNVMITAGGQVKVADFGLAKRLMPVVDTGATTNVSRELEVIGTLPYMPPEQLRGDPADFRSDIYSAGAVLYELATGRRVFPETHGPRLIDSILHQTPLSPGTFNRRLSHAFESVVDKCLEKEPSRRYQTAAELGTDLQHLSFSTRLLQNEWEIEKRKNTTCSSSKSSLHKKVLWCSALSSHFRKGSFGTAGESNEFPVRQADRGPLLKKCCDRRCWVKNTSFSRKPQRLSTRRC